MSSLPPDDISRVGRAMLSEIDQTMTHVVSAVWDHIPGYSEVRLDRHDLTARIQHTVLTATMCLYEGRAPSSAELARAHRAGERRALQGVDQATMVQSFRTTERMLGREFSNWCSRMQVRGTRQIVGHEALIRALDQLEHAMFDGYRQIARRLEDEAQLSEPALFQRLATGEGVDAEEIRRLSAALDIDVPEQRIFIAMAAVETEHSEQGELEQLRHHLVAHLSSALALPVLSATVNSDTGRVVLMAIPWEHTAEGLLSTLRDAVSSPELLGLARASIGEPSTGLASLGRSCRQAMLALEANAADNVVVYADLLLEIIVRHERTLSRQIVARYLDPLGDTDLISTLRAHIDNNLSLTATAAALHVHKNTVVYRLRRITEIIGVDLHKPRDIARIVVAFEAVDATESVDGRPRHGSDAAQ